MKTNQFINTGTKWVFNPTVKFIMTTADYQLIIKAVKADPAKKAYVDQYGTAEYYYGASSYYSEFNAQISKRATQAAFQGLTAAQANALITKRIEEGIIVMLQAKFPNAVAQVSGINVMYVVTYAVYENDGSTVKFTATFQCIKSSPNPQFKLVGEPTQAK